MGALDAVLNAVWPPRTYRRGALEVRDTYGARPIASQLNRPVWPKRGAQVYTDDAYAKLALVFRCTGILSQAVASAPLRVYRELPDGAEPHETHPVRQLLVNPNRESNEARFLAQVAMTMAVAGFCVIEKERAAGGWPVALWPVNPAWCKPVPRRDALPDWEVRVPGYEPVTLAAEDVIALTFADRPDMTPTGIGPVEIVLREVALLNTMTDFLKAFFDQGAMPVYGLIPSPDLGELSQAQVDLVKEKWRQRYGGLSRATDPAILQGIQDVRRLSFDFDELAFTDLRDLSDLSITQAFGVPPILAGSRFGLERSTFANYGEARRSFYEDTVSPLWNRIEDAFSRQLLPEFAGSQPYSLSFDISNVPAMRDDQLPRKQFYLSALSGGGITRNDFRRELGLPTVTGGDVFLQSMATVEVPATAESGRRSLGAGHEVRALPSGSLYRLSHEQRSTVGAMQKRQIERIAGLVAPLLAVFFHEQGGRVWEAFSSGQYDAGGFDWFAELVVLRELVSGVHVTAMEAAFASVSDLGLAVNWDLHNPHVASTISSLGERIVGIDATTRADVQRVISDALDEGVTMGDLEIRLTGLFDETYQGRSRTIARTETMYAYNQGSVLAYQDSGVVGYVECMDNKRHTEHYGASDGLSCAERDGTIWPLDQASIPLNGEHPNGTLALAPVLSVKLGELEGDI